MKRLKEIEERLQQIRAQLRGEGDVDLDALEKEIADLEAERAQIIRRQEMANRAAEGMVPGLRMVEGTNPTGEEDEARAKRFVEPPEYRDAWATAMLGFPMTEEQRSVYEKTNAEYRAFTHTTTNTAVLIPQTVVGGIWKRTEEAYPLWADVRKMHVPGELIMKKHIRIVAGDAAWYDEDTETADEQNEFGDFRLTGCELAKNVNVSWKLRSMAVPEFISFIEEELAERIGVALGYGAYSGKGKPGQSDSFKPEPRGIKTALLAETSTPQVVTYQTTGSNAGLTDTILRKAVAKIHSSYTKKAAVYVNNDTAWTVLADIKDAQKRPIFLTDQAVQGAVGRVFGLPVKVDAAIGDGEILIGDAYNGYTANIPEDMTMVAEDHATKRNTDYMAYGIVDGDTFDNMAFALVMPAATASSET